MQANGWLVKNIEDTHQSRAHLSRQADALRLTTGKRARGAIQGQIVQADISQKAEARFDLLNDALRDSLLPFGEG